MHLVLRFFDIEPGKTFDSDLTNEGMLLCVARSHFDSLAHSLLSQTVLLSAHGV